MNHYLNLIKTTVSGFVLAACSLFYSNAYAVCAGSANDYYCNQQNADENLRNLNNTSDNYGYGNNRGGSAPVYLPTKPSKYGAVAFDQKTSTYGYSSAQKSARLAKSVALTDCGLSECKITSTYANQCAALTWGNNGKSGWLYFHPNLNLDVAKEEALAECQSKGGSCQIVMAECSLP